MQPFNKEQYEILAAKMISGSISSDEQNVLDEWAAFLEHKEGGGITNSPNDPVKNRILARIKEDLGFSNLAQQAKRSFHLSWKIAATVFILIALSGGYYIYRNLTPAPITEINDIAPASSGAVLTLSDGSTVLLDSMVSQISDQGDVNVTNRLGMLAYNLKATPNAATSIQFNTLTTPNGRQYKLRLPDGTLVWLNAGSSIKYPVVFTGKYRQVELSGEAYFDVVHNAAHPFRVKAGNQQIEDLGTEFNVSAYQGSTIKTTLIEGSVSVSDKADMVGIILKPGEQSVGNNGIQVVNADLEEAVDWKNGYFIFNDDNIVTIMDELHRWYNVTVSFAPGVSKELKFGGIISRQKKISAVLNMMRATGKVNFELKGRDKIIVTNEQ